MKKQTAKLKTQDDRIKHNMLPSDEAIRRHMLSRGNCQERADMAPDLTSIAYGVEFPAFIGPAVLVTLEDALGIVFTGSPEDAIATLIDAVLGEGAVKIILDAPPSDPDLLRENEHDVMFVRLSVSQKITVPAEPEA